MSNTEAEKLEVDFNTFAKGVFGSRHRFKTGLNFRLKGLGKEPIGIPSGNTGNSIAKHDFFRLDMLNTKDNLTPVNELQANKSVLWKIIDTAFSSYTGNPIDENITYTPTEIPYEKTGLYLFSYISRLTIGRFFASIEPEEKYWSYEICDQTGVTSGEVSRAIQVFDRLGVTNIHNMKNSSNFMFSVNPSPVLDIYQTVSDIYPDQR